MVLVLSVLRCPDQSVPEQRRVQGGEYVMGRGAECDWALADPDRVLSKRHCAVEFLSGAWQVRDVSTNGTFLNAATEPVGRGQVRTLRDGDRLRLGAYEIECRVEEEETYGSGRWQSANAIPDPMAPPTGASDIFSAPLPGLSPAGGPPSGTGALLPSDFDPFAPEDLGPVMPDHRPSTNDVFTPPRATMPDLLPTDWDAPSAAKPQAADPFAGLPDPFADMPAPPPARPPEPFAESAAPFASPLEKLPDPFADLGQPATPPAPFPETVVPAALPAVAALPDPLARFGAPVLGRNPFAEEDAPAASHVAAAAPILPGVAPAGPGAVSGDGLDAALALIYRSAGLGPPPPNTDAAAALAAVGAGMRAAVAGMRALLIARADVKREFRIEQTMLRAAGNNPVKFAATDEAAVLALLGPKGNGPAALAETVQDLTAHQLATLAATQAAAKALLARLAPTGLEAEIAGGGIMPGAREKKLWEAYRKLHQQVTDQFEDDFDSAFGKAFARAYEEASRGGR